ncbi:MAG TPA: glycosyltransferase family 2 protein [Solirubrobacteraceae bacterium]|nr:glycosyltransferase family 2 protein [Solirubrobacteraceae bacterium]
MRSSITTIIVTYNSATVLRPCVDSLRDHIKPARILVVDNASKDESIEVARALDADVIANEANLGYGAGCNLGARYATTPLLMFVNPDVCIASVDCMVLSKLAIRNPFGLVAPRALLEGDGRRQALSLRCGVPWPCDIVREALGPLMPPEVRERIRSPSGVIGGYRWLSGALLLCDREEFLGLGGFDERLFLYYEDRELSLKYSRSGLPLSVTDGITGCHAWGGSSGEGASERTIPAAASALSSIEFVGIAHGVPAARWAWTLYQLLSRVAVAAASVVAIGHFPRRAKRKRGELLATRLAVQTLLGVPGPFYPLVKDFASRRSATAGASSTADLD